MELKENERIDDLQLNGLKIIQNKNAFCFGIDAVLLSSFASKIKKDSVVADLCSGTGIVAILIEAKTKCRKIYAVEIQEEMAEMAKRSVVMNNQESVIEVMNEDIRNLDKKLGKASLDAITINPPYQKMGSGIKNELNTKTIARHEVFGSLEEMLHVSALLLKTNGSIYMVHRIDRLIDVLQGMRKENIEPKRIQMIHPSCEKASNLFMVEGVKNGKPFLKMEPSIYVYDADGNYTKTIKQIYG